MPGNRNVNHSDNFEGEVSLDSSCRGANMATTSAHKISWHVSFFKAYASPMAFRDADGVEKALLTTLACKRLVLHTVERVSREPK